VYLKVTDSKGNTAQSETARIKVSPVPVGGYIIPTNINTETKLTTLYIMLMAILTITFKAVKRKTTKSGHTVT
jgi:hypothetical protein